MRSNSARWQSQVAQSVSVLYRVPTPLVVFSQAPVQPEPLRMQYMVTLLIQFTMMQGESSCLSNI